MSLHSLTQLFIVLDCAIAYIVELLFVKNGVEILNLTVGFQKILSSGAAIKLYPNVNYVVSYHIVLYTTAWVVVDLQCEFY